jgi:riboflavin synthase
MFTGIIEKQARVVANLTTENGRRLIINAAFANLEIGESIAVNGVCLTLIAVAADNLHFEVSPETLELTNLASLAWDEMVNLERAMLATSRFGGHYVSGHVDGLAEVAAIHALGEFSQVELAGFDMRARYYLMDKGSISVDGVSLTINNVLNQSINLMLIPQTLTHTTLGRLKIGQKVNIEFDYLAKMVANMLKLAKHEVPVCT